MTTFTSPSSANERLKSHFESMVASGLVIAVLAHLMVFQFFPEMSVEDWASVVGTEVPIMNIDIPLPAPPQKIARPASPVPTPGVEVTTTLPLFGFDEVPDLPPPPPAAHDVTTGTPNGFAVYTVAPVLIDPERFQRDLLRTYPDQLRDAAIGGRVVLQIAIDERGQPTSATVATSSGYQRLDQAALELVERMRFRPAMNRDKRVAVLVSIPIEFRVRR